MIRYKIIYTYTEVPSSVLNTSDQCDLSQRVKCVASIRLYNLKHSIYRYMTVKITMLAKCIFTCRKREYVHEKHT